MVVNQISKTKALEILDKKISHFQELISNANYNNDFSGKYEDSVKSTKRILTILFPTDLEAQKFDTNISEPRIRRIGSYIDPEEELTRYKRCLEKGINQLSAYKEVIQELWSDESNEGVLVDRLIVAREHKARLEEQLAAFGPLYAPVYKLIELDSVKEKISELEKLSIEKC